MSNYEKPKNDLGAIWEKTSKSSGAKFLSIMFDPTHDPETARSIAHMLLSGQPVSFAASLNKRFDPNDQNSRKPKWNMYMGRDQHEWMLANYNRVYPQDSAPRFDRNSSYGSSQSSYAPQTPTARPQENGYSPQNDPARNQQYGTGGYATTPQMPTPPQQTPPPPQQQNPFGL